MLRIALAAMLAILPARAATAQTAIPCDVAPGCEPEKKEPAIPAFEIVIRPATPVKRPVAQPLKPRPVPARPKAQTAPKPKQATVRVKPKPPATPDRAKSPPPSWQGLPQPRMPILAGDDFAPVEGQYIVDLDPAAIRAAGFDLLTMPISQIAALLGIRPNQIRSVQREFMLSAVLRATASEAAAMRGNAIVRAVHRDTKIKAMGGAPKAPPLSWGLDRLDLPALPLDGRFDRSSGDYQARLYLFDSGVDSANAEFGTRISWGARFANAYPDTSGHCRDHGTEMASLITGANTGAAPRAEVIDVVVLPCSTDIPGEGSSLIEAGEWLLLREKAAVDNRPVIVNMSLAGPFSEKINDAVSVLTRNGVAVVVAAGNNYQDACGFSPASAPDAVTVSATGPHDEVADFANFGACVDVHAPGRYVTAISGNLKDGAYVAVSGTSGAAALVSGVLARSLKAKGPAAAAQWLAETAVPSSVWNSKEPDLKLAQATAGWRRACRAAAPLALRPRPSPVLPASATISKGEYVEVRKVSGDWIELVSASGGTGWTGRKAGKTTALLAAAGDGPCAALQ